MHMQELGALSIQPAKPVSPAFEGLPLREERRRLAILVTYKSDAEFAGGYRRGDVNGKRPKNVSFSQVPFPDKRGIRTRDIVRGVEHN